MRIELWNLFREDVRDVFECTRANMDNYMVVGTLIIASAILPNLTGKPLQRKRSGLFEESWRLVFWFSISDD